MAMDGTSDDGTDDGTDGGPGGTRPMTGHRRVR